VTDFGIKESENVILERTKFISTPEQEIAWLLKAVTFIDLTTLGGDDTRKKLTIT